MRVEAFVIAWMGYKLSVCDHLSRLTSKQFPSIVPFTYLWSKSFVVGYFRVLDTNDLSRRILYML